MLRFLTIFLLVLFLLCAAPGTSLAQSANDAAPATGPAGATYPVEAARGGIKGDVLLHVIIGTDGSVKQVEVTKGHPALAPAAVDAFGQFRYQETFLDGAPVEVDSSILIEFRLH